MWKLSFGAIALVCATPAMAEDLGCWDTAAVTANTSPSGTYLNSASPVDYIEPTHEGVDALLGGLSDFEGGAFVVCMDGDSLNQDGDTVWQLSAAVICSVGSYSIGECPG